MAGPHARFPASKPSELYGGLASEEVRARVANTYRPSFGGKLQRTGSVGCLPPPNAALVPLRTGSGTISREKPEASDPGRVPTCSGRATGGRRLPVAQRRAGWSGGRLIFGRGALLAPSCAAWGRAGMLVALETGFPGACARSGRPQPFPLFLSLRLLSLPLAG